MEKSRPIGTATEAVGLQLQRILTIRHTSVQRFGEACVFDELKATVAELEAKCVELEEQFDELAKRYKEEFELRCSLEDYYDKGIDKRE
jgi:hypothetical protein